MPFDRDVPAAPEPFAAALRELRELAAVLLQHERKSHTLQPTALVHEAWLKLQQQNGGAPADRAQFLAAAATAMRRILVDHARSRGRQKRGGGAGTVPLDDTPVLVGPGAIDLVAVDEALDRLAHVDARMARLVELRFFAGLDPAEAAVALGTSLRTCEREWALARAWLRRELAG